MGVLVLFVPLSINVHHLQLWLYQSSGWEVKFRGVGNGDLDLHWSAVPAGSSQMYCQ